MTYFCPALDPPLDGSGRKTTTLVRDLEYFIHTKFHQNPSSGSGEEVENVNSLTDDGRTDDGRTTDGRRTTRDHNTSLEPIGSCALKIYFQVEFLGILLCPVCLSTLTFAASFESWEIDFIFAMLLHQ